MGNVLNSFVDRETGKLYRIGDTYKGSAARIAELAKNGFVNKPKTTARGKSKAKTTGVE